MALSASGKRDETKKDTKRTCRKHQKKIDKELINKLPRDIILIISKMHPLIIPPFTNKTLRRAVKDYLAGGDRKKRIVEKYGEISTWDVSNVKDMHGLFKGATFFNGGHIGGHVSGKRKCIISNVRFFKAYESFYNIFLVVITLYFQDVVIF